MIEFNIGDLVVFEDEYNNIYQDCVCNIVKGSIFKSDLSNYYFIYMNGFILQTDLEYNLVDFIFENFDKWGCDRPETKVHLKELWHKVNNDTYKRIVIKI